MSVRIRLTRIGTKNLPAYRIVVADRRQPRDGRFIEVLGTYDPKKARDNVTINMERAQHWLKAGAEPTDTVRSLLKRAAQAKTN
jgi:small subunit ribosomal protein S16